MLNLLNLDYTYTDEEGQARRQHVLDAVRNCPAIAAEAKGALDRAWSDREVEHRAAIAGEQARGAEAVQFEKDKALLVKDDVERAWLSREEQHGTEIAAERAKTAVVQAELDALAALCRDPEIAARLAALRAPTLTPEQVQAKRDQAAALLAEVAAAEAAAPAVESP